MREAVAPDAGTMKGLRSTDSGAKRCGIAKTFAAMRFGAIFFPRRRRPPVKQFRCARGTLIRRIFLRGTPERRRLMSALVTFLGCSLVLAGFAAERFAECRWLAASGPAPLDACAVLGLALPAVGLTLMATLAA